MALQPEDTWLNLERTLFYWVYQKLEIDDTRLKGKISYDDSEFDASGKDRWVTIQILDVGVGVGADPQVQFTISQRKEGDPFGARMKQAADLVRAAMNINAIPMQDFGTELEGGSPNQIYLDGNPLEMAVRHTGPNGRLPEAIPGVLSSILTYTLHLWRNTIVE